ncbi:MAG: DNA-directed RNA polymerase subunit beta, partial [Thermoanaerobaculia bacterium]
MNGAMPKQEPVRHDFSKIRSYMALPNLIDVQRKSYDRFLQMNLLPEEREDTGLQSVFTSVFPFSDFRETCSLDFVRFAIGNWECKCGQLKGLEHLRMTCANCGAKIITDHPHEETVNCGQCGVINKNRVEVCDICGNPVDLQMKYSVEECQERGMTYSVPLKVTFRLFVYDKDPDTGVKHMRDAKEEEVFFGDIPLMTDNGTFIINGTERVIVSQLHRSPGVFFTKESAHTFLSKIIPYRGSWVEFEYDQKNLLYVRIDRKRKFLASVFLRALGLRGADEIIRTFYSVDRIFLNKGNSLLWAISDSLVGLRAAADVKAGDFSVQSGKKISANAVAALRKANIETIAVVDEALEGAFAAADIVDPETGEVILEANEELTPRVISMAQEKKVERLDVFFPERDETGP